jgi:preprotein translocase subunit Sss1
MLKTLAIFTFAFLVLCVQGNCQSHKAEQKQKSNQLILPIPHSPVQKDDSLGFQSKSEQDASTEVRIISTPAKDRYDKAAVWINAVLAIVGFIGIVIAIITLIKIHHQTEIAARTLVLTQRPRIEVRTFYFSQLRGVGLPDSPSGISEASSAGGQFYIVNTGGTRAKIKEIVCKVFVWGGTLPAKRPYEGEIGSQKEKVLEAGQSTFYLFGLLGDLIDAETSNWLRSGVQSFYVLGWIGYTDDLGIYRITHFCRRYDPSKERFSPVDDIEYEKAN